MRTRWSLQAAVACIVLLAAAGVGVSPGERAQAQDVRALIGTYKVADYALNDKSNPVMATALGRLHLLPNGNYVWGAYHAPYRVTGQRIELDCRASGDYTSDRKLNLRRTKPEVGQTYKYGLEYEGTLEAIPPGRTLAPKGCNWEQHASPVWNRQVLAAARREPVGRTLQAQASPPRVVDGELLLTIKRQGYTPADVALWSCLITEGYPRLEFLEQPGAQPQEVFVWPDARFRTELRGGVRYQFSLLPSTCDTPRRQLGARMRKEGPVTPPATEEKVVVACYVSGGRLVECDGWWLIRP
jgi:hypothetical protein